MRKLKVELGENSYSILIDRQLIRDFSEHIRAFVKDRRCLVVTDSNVRKLYGQSVLESLARSGVVSAGEFSFAAGEASKNYNTLKKIYQACVKSRLDRSSVIIALGGGVCGDLAGFAAATFMRGIDFIQVPTTLLAMVDSSVGGKTGIDLPEGKNLVGAFWQPRIVLIDPGTLETLSQREIAGGLAEVVKYGVIRDGDFFSFLENNTDRILSRDEGVYADIIARCCKIKAEIVSEDEKENSLRAILNFGHTFGHAVERVAGYGKFVHGEAVAIGMLMASRLSVLCGLTDDKVFLRIRGLCMKLGLPQKAEGVSSDDVYEAMTVDKKAQGGSLRFVLPVRGIGVVNMFADIDKSLIERAIKEFI